MGGLYLKSEVMWREAAVRRDPTSHLRVQWCCRVRVQCLLCAKLAVGAAPAKARSSGFAAA